MGQRILAVLLLVSASVSASRADQDAESRIRAAFVYNFTKVTYWPSTNASSDSLLLIGVVGADPAELALDSIDGKSVDSSRIVVRRIESPELAATCQILFFAAVPDDSLGRYLENVSASPVLTVSAMPGFGERGGMIEFVRRRNRLALRINLDAATKVQLRFSSQLLKVAEIYERET